MALDIHRDAGLPTAPVVEIQSQRAAQILIIVGSDARLPHPHWRQNEAFARHLAQKMNALYPGLCRGVRVQEGRYNQHLLPRALLLEVGTEKKHLGGSGNLDALSGQSIGGDSGRNPEKRCHP